MTDFFQLMGIPLLTCLVLTGIHAYLGLHVIQRQIIFVDISLAQIAALGTVLAVLFGFDIHAAATYWFSLAATFLAAVIFSLTRTQRQTLHQEVIIGIVYVVSAALAVLLLHRVPEGDEHIRHMLVGNILLTDLPSLIKMAALYAAIGLIHWRFCDRFLAITVDPVLAAQQGVAVKRWDLLFYITFGIVVTSSVEIAGVLLVFTFLIIPAAAAQLLSKSVSGRLWTGWIFGTAGSALGLAASYALDLPTGPAVVCAFGVLFFLTAILKK